MKRQVFRGMGLALVLLLAGGCSDDGEKTDSGTVPDQSVYDIGTTGDTNTTTGDTNTTTGDTNTTTKDTGTTTGDKGVAADTGSSKDLGKQPDWGTSAPPNTGTACTTPQNVCPNTQDECIVVGGSAQNKGMCLIQCQTKYAACPTANPTTQKSICFLDFTGTPAATYCAYMCKYENKTYTCPAGSTCTSISANTSVCNRP